MREVGSLQVFRHFAEGLLGNALDFESGVLGAGWVQRMSVEVPGCSDPGGDDLALGEVGQLDSDVVWI